MNRVDRWLTELRDTLRTADELAARGRGAFDDDPAIRLAFEALSNRVGEIAKRLRGFEPQRFSDDLWGFAARNRDFVVHHYDRIDVDALWQTVTRDFPRLRAALDDIGPSGGEGAPVDSGT